MSSYVYNLIMYILDLNFLYMIFLMIGLFVIYLIIICGDYFMI